MVDIALQTAQLSACPAGDANNDKVITVDEILQAVNNALVGCATIVPGCGNGVVEANLGEECDDGGTCIGGASAGQACTKEADCQGNGICIGGDKKETACDPTNANACPGSSCQKCIPQGGDGCAANCTLETTVQMPLKPGVLIDPATITPGTSGSTVWNGVLGPLALTMVGGQTMVVGKAVNNQIPVVVNASHIDPIDVSGLSCACVRGIPDMTCGGMLIEADGVTLATDCTPGYIMGTCDTTTPTSCTTETQDTDCPVSQTCEGGICADCRTDDDCSNVCVMHACDGQNLPCAFVHGLGGTCSVTTTQTCRQDSNCPSGETCVRGGNMSSGVISCVSGLATGTNMLMTEDSRRADGQEDPPECDFTNSDTYVVGSTFPDCGSIPVLTLSDQSPAPIGAALVINSTAIGQFVGSCAHNPNAPAGWCTDQEAYNTRGTPNTLPAVTGTASAEMFNIFLGGATTDQAVCACADIPPSYSCPVVTPCAAGSTCCSGPLSLLGHPLPSCSQLSQSPPNISGAGLAGAFTALANPTIGDEVITDLLQAGTWSTLATSIGATDTTITLVDASSFPTTSFPNGGSIASAPAAIEGEEITYTGKSGNQLTGVTRGFNLTTATAHSAGATVVH